MAGKLTKQELKEPDKFQVLLSRIMMFLTEYRQKLYIAGAILLLLVVAFGGWYLYDASMEKSAHAIYLRIYALNADDDKAAIDILKEVVSKYPSSRAAALSNYRLGNLYFRQNDFNAAVKAFEAFLKQTPDKSDLKPLAYIGLGFSYEAVKDYKNALAAFEKVPGTRSGSVYEGANDQNIARVYEAMNDRAKALEYYKKALAKNTDPFSEMLIKRKIATLS